jgi:hypothetical protein
MGMSGISKSQVSRMCEEIDGKIAAFLDRPLEGDWPYLWLDATYLKARMGGRIVSTAVTTTGWWRFDPGLRRGSEQGAPVARTLPPSRSAQPLRPGTARQCSEGRSATVAWSDEPTLSPSAVSGPPFIR